MTHTLPPAPIDVQQPEPSPLARTLAALGRSIAQRHGGTGPTDAQVAEQLGVRPVRRAPRPPATASSRAIVRAHEIRVEAEASSSSTSSSTSSRIRMRALPATRRGRAHFASQLAAQGLELDPLDWTNRAWSTARATAGELSAREARRGLAELPACYARRLRRAALGITERDPGAGLEPCRTFEHVVARRIVALGVILYREACATRRHGMGRVLVGRSRAMIAALFVNPQTGERYHVSTLYATDHHGTGDLYDCGDVVALHRAGVIWREQPPADAVPPSQRGPSGYALNQYWISELACSSELEPVDLRERLALPGLGPAALDAPPPT